MNFLEQPSNLFALLSLQINYELNSLCDGNSRSSERKQLRRHEPEIL